MALIKQTDAIKIELKLDLNVRLILLEFYRGFQKKIHSLKTRKISNDF